MSKIQELITEATGFDDTGHSVGVDDYTSDLIMRLADALEAAQPTVVTTAEELQALPVGSVVVDASGTARMNRHGDSRMGGGWTQAGRDPLKSTELADGRPMTVVHRGRQYRPVPTGEPR